MRITLVGLLLFAVISTAHSQAGIETTNETAIHIQDLEPSIKCQLGECKDNADGIHIYLLNEEIVRQLLVQVVQGTLTLSNFSQHWQIITYLSLCILISTAIGVYLCSLHRNIRKKMVYFFRFIHYRSSYQESINKAKVFVLLALFTATVTLSYFALLKSEQIQTALHNTLTIFNQGDYAEGNQSILVGKGGRRSQFHEELMNYQFSLNRVKTKCNHLIGYRHLQDLQLAVKDASKLLPNNTMLDVLEDETDKIGLVIATIQEQARIIVEFINFVRDELIGNHLKFIKVQKLISQFIAVQQLPELLSSWIKALIIGILAISICLLLIFFKVCLTGLLIFTKHINKINFLYSFLITITFFTLFIHFSATNAVYTGCILKLDFQNANQFQKYFENYNTDFGSSMYAEYLRKVEGHTNGDLSVVMQTDVFNATNLALSSFAGFKRIVTSSQMDQTNDQIMEASMDQNVSFVNANTNETYFAQNITVFLQKIEQISVDLQWLSNYKNARLFDYDMHQIGRYLSAITVQVCQSDFSLLLYFNFYYFCIVILAILQFKIILSLIKLKNSKQEHMIELAVLSRTNI